MRVFGKSSIIEYFWYPLKPLNNRTRSALPSKPKKKEEIIDDDASEDEEDILEERRIMAESIIKRIEKYSVIVYFLIFVIFNIWYWVDMITCANSNYEQFEQNYHLSAKKSA